ncbi:nitrate reductase [Catenovulum maritimum]|uniref:Nitrate reductase n=1 Tax=Catenovulum maritimum TaxID=1513271 RepID=A0A0J8GNB1_9ALTE|nr:nitrate reductase [Catenovulum maritimum]KMT64295.1 nitrate reductase [Catenovulum maritimum]
MKNTAVKLKQTTCPYCGVGCGIDVNMDSMTLTQVNGSSEHPANFGRLCVKGSSVLETNDVSGRLLQPMIGDSAASWDEAISHVASGFKQVIDEHGPQAVAFYVSGQLLTEDYYVANKLMKGYIGAANIDTNSRLCMSSAVAGYKRAFGSDTVPCNYEDLEDTDLLVLVGSNAAWTHPVLFQRMERAKKLNPNLQVVVVDPRKSATTELADIHLAIKPGTDVALFNGLLHYIANNQALDTDYISQFTEGFDACLASVEQASLEQTAAICDVDVDDLARYFALFVNSPSAITFYCMGVNQSSQGTDKCNAIINCHLATGKIGKVGSGPFSITGQPNAMGGREVGGLANMLAAHMDIQNPQHTDLVQRFWQSPTISTEMGAKAVDMFEKIQNGDIKAVWIMATNPAVSLPNGNSVADALKNCPLVVVSDCNENTDTSAWADVRLPATGWSEKNGTVTNSERRISRQRGLLPPSGQAKHDWQIICEVAKAMGFEQGFDYQHPYQIFDEHARLSAFENNGTRDFDISGLVGLSEAEYDKFRPIQWPVNAAYPQGRARMFDDGKFFTPSGKAQFISVTAQAPKQLTSAEYPLVCNSGRIRDQWHTMTRTGKAAKLTAHISEPFVAMHPDDANLYQLQENQIAKISSAFGDTLLKVKIDSGQRKGELFAPMHWTKQFASRSNINVLYAPAVDPISGQPELKHAAVKIEAYQADFYAISYSKHAVFADTEYWVKAPNSAGHQLSFAGTGEVTDWLDWCQQRANANGEWIRVENNSDNSFKVFCYSESGLEFVCYIQATPFTEDMTWLSEMYNLETFDRAEIKALVAGIPTPEVAKGRQICSCFQVGEKQIIEAIVDYGDDTVEKLGERLQCGTNCGSCKTDLSGLIKSHCPAAVA